MIRPKMKCSHRISKNFYDYYLLKWKIKNKIKLHLHTLPDPLVLELGYDFFVNNKSTLKILFNMLETSRLEYYKDSGKFVIYSKDKKNKQQFEWDILVLETIEKAIEFCKTIIDHDKDFLQVGIDEADFFIRKKVSSDIQIIQENFLEEQYSFIYPFVKNSIVIDIGANIGDTAILFCRKGAKKVYAYEPHPFFFDIASKNIKLNKLSDNITLSPYGAGAIESSLTLKDDSVLGPTGSFGLKKTGRNKEIEIEIISFSKIIENIDDPIVVKMDCEGFEFDAILSSSINTLRKIKAMAVEFHDDPDPIIKHLKRAGFEVEIKRDILTKYRRIGLLFAIVK